MSAIFSIVYEWLVALSLATGLSYKAINVVVYFGVIPFVYLALIDRLLERHVLKFGFAFLTTALVIFVPNFEHSSSWLFDRSVDFLMAFDVIGWDYVTASVNVCVVLPLLAFGGLVLLVVRKRRTTAAPPH